MLVAAAVLVLAIGGLTACERGGEGDDALNPQQQNGQTQNQPREGGDSGMQQGQPQGQGEPQGENVPPEGNQQPMPGGGSGEDHVAPEEPQP